MSDRKTERVSMSPEEHAESLKNAVNEKGLYNAIQDELDEIALIGRMKLDYLGSSEVSERCANILGLLEASGFTPNATEEELRRRFLHQQERHGLPEESKAVHVRAGQRFTAGILHGLPQGSG